MASPTPEKVIYTVAKWHIHDGDVLLFAGHNFFARAIKLWTNSPYSHAALAYWRQQGDHLQLCLLEAMDGIGVRSCDMDTYIVDCIRQGIGVYWFPLGRDLDRRKIVAYALEQVGKKYADPGQFLVSFGKATKLARALFGKGVEDTDPDRFFCSELVAGALEAGGAPRIEVPYATSPGAIADFPCLETGRELTGAA